MKTKEQIADDVQDASADAVQFFSCPGCRGNLNIQFAPAGTRGKGAGSLSVMCRRCMWRVISDGIPSEPPWVQVLGQKIQTAAASENSSSDGSPKNRSASAAGDPA